MTQMSPERLRREHWLSIRDTKNPANKREQREINEHLKNEVGRTKKERNRIKSRRNITTAPSDPNDEFNVAQRNFVTALNNYLEFTHLTKGYQAAVILEQESSEWVAYSMKCIGEAALLVATTAAILAAAAALEYATVGATGGAFIGPAIALVKAKWAALIAGFVAGAAISGAANWTVYLAKTRNITPGDIQRARTDEKKNYDDGGTFSEMRNSESGNILAQNSRAIRHARFWAFVTGIVASVGGYATFNNSNGTEIVQAAGYAEGGSVATAADNQMLANTAQNIRNLFGMLFGYVGVAQAKPSTPLTVPLSTTEVTSTGGSGKVEPGQGGRGSSQPATADSRPGGEASNTDASKTRTGLPPREITKLGEFPFAGSPEEAFSDPSIRRAAEWLAQKEGWSQAKKDAFIKYMTEHRADYIAAAKDPNYRGPLVDSLHGDERIMDAMVDKGGVRGPVKVPEGTRAMVVEFPYMEADGTKKVGKVVVPVECFNFGDPAGADVVTPPEVAPAPKETTFLLTSQEMCIDGKAVKETFIITVRSLAPGQTWEQAIQEAVEKLRGRLPAGDGGIPINQDVAIVRVDLNGDGIPETTKQVNLKTGEITDLIIRPQGGGSINVTELPPNEQDLQTEGSNDGMTTVVDPTYSLEKGSLKNTPNPPHEWMVKDGRLQRVIPIGPNGEMILTPASLDKLIYEYLRIFINHILQKDVVVDVGGGEASGDVTQTAPEVAPSSSEKALNSWLQAPVDEWRNMSAKEMAQKYGMTETEAKRILKSIPQYEARCREAGRSVEPKPGQTTISYLEDIFAALSPDRR